LHKLKILSIQDELILEKNLVWLFADRRSGTTWLARKLLSSYTKCMDEPLIGLHLGRFVETEYGFMRTIEIQKERPEYFFSEPYQDSWELFLKKLILNRIHNQFDNLSDKIIIKEPTGSIAADIIAKCLPNSKIIIMLRDGRDVIDSKIDAVSSGGWEIVKNKGLLKPITEKTRLRYIRRHAKFWTALMKILMKTYNEHPKELRYKLHYEDIRQNTLEELKKLYKFLEIDTEEENLVKIISKYSFEKIPENEKGKRKFRRFANPGKWKENFSEEEKKVMGKIMSDTLKELGYS